MWEVLNYPKASEYYFSSPETLSSLLAPWQLLNPVWNTETMCGSMSSITVVPPDSKDTRRSCRSWLRRIAQIWDTSLEKDCIVSSSRMKTTGKWLRRWRRCTATLRNMGRYSAGFRIHVVADSETRTKLALPNGNRIPWIIPTVTTASGTRVERCEMSSVPTESISFRSSAPRIRIWRLLSMGDRKQW